MYPFSKLPVAKKQHFFLLFLSGTVIQGGWVCEKWALYFFHSPQIISTYIIIQSHIMDAGSLIGSGMKKITS